MIKDIPYLKDNTREGTKIRKESRTTSRHSAQMQNRSTTETTTQQQHGLALHQQQKPQHQTTTKC